MSDKTVKIDPKKFAKVKFTKNLGRNKINDEKTMYPATAQGLLSNNYIEVLEVLDFVSPEKLKTAPAKKIK